MKIVRLPSPNKLKKQLPLPSFLQERIFGFRASLKTIMDNPHRLVFIVGPCSIYDKSTTLEYAKKLKLLAEEIASTSFVIMRAYIEKPRTTHGWKGYLYQHDLQLKPDLDHGLVLARELLLELTEIGLPLAMEFVEPLASYYFDDLITWGCVGARTCASQIHRQLASSLDFPVGIKNSIDGNTELAIQAMAASSMPHTFLGLCQEGYIASVNSRGNGYTHLVLRGSESGVNHDRTSIEKAFEHQKLYHFSSPILVDCAHGNSKKNLIKQQEIFLQLIKEHTTLYPCLLGAMLESFLEDGSQETTHPSLINPRRSITDPCLNWTITKSLLLQAHEHLSRHPRGALLPV
jgi:3-deoxy-7-phosphoheptulonate synthase